MRQGQETTLEYDVGVDDLGRLGVVRTGARAGAGRHRRDHAPGAVLLAVTKGRSRSHTDGLTLSR